MRAFVVTVASDEVDTASDALWQLGVRAIEERDTALGKIELWTMVGDEPAAFDRAIESLHGAWQHRIVEVPDEPAQTWREFATPMWVSDEVVVVPAWQDAPEATLLTVSIEPAGAFGLGDHPTTMLSLRALSRILQDRDHHHGRPADVLDVGCGTGVVAIVAVLLGGGSSRAIDVADAAVEATIDNARRNGVAERVVVDATPLGELDGTYDVVVANILAPVLVSLADDLRRVTSPTGRLVLSGILSDSHQHVLDALAPMVVERTDVLDGWASVVLAHPPSTSASQPASTRH